MVVAQINKLIKIKKKIVGLKKIKSCYERISVSCSDMSDSLPSHGLYPARLLRPWHYPGKNTGSGLLLPSPGNLPNPGIEPGSPALQTNSLQSEPPGKPCDRIYLIKNKPIYQLNFPNTHCNYVPLP